MGQSKVLDKSLTEKRSQPSVSSHNLTHKELHNRHLPYSHGLEHIYSFETIDPKLVRKLNTQDKTPTSIINEALETSPPVQLRLPFSMQYTETLPSLRLYEPLDVLGISPFAFKALVQLGKKTVADVLHLVDSPKTPQKSLGQGHLEEIREKITTYLGPNPHYKKRIDLVALLRALCAQIEPKRRFLLLAKFSLQHIFPLSSNDHYDLLKLTPQMRKKAIDIVIQDIRNNELELLHKSLRDIGAAFYIHWLRHRFGFSSEINLYNRLLSLVDPAISREHTAKIITLLETIIGESSLFKKMLYIVENNVYAAHSHIAEEFHTVRDIATSYFYNSNSSYPLEKLVYYTACECAMKWLPYNSVYIEQVLRTSCHFTLSRNNDIPWIHQARY